MGPRVVGGERERERKKNAKITMILHLCLAARPPRGENATVALARTR